MLTAVSTSVQLLYCQIQAMYYLVTGLLLRVLYWPREKLFTTEDSLELELCQLEREALENERMVQTQSEDNDVPEVKVTEMSEKALKINLSLSKKGKLVVPLDDECEDYDNPISPDIEVVCERQSRNIHGILKQRSRSHSESSDDVSSVGGYSRENSTSSGSHMSESPISESEELEGFQDGRLKKSVSFSEHVDKATFKPGATVSSMTTALKSKRRRNRKREEKKRRRHNSNGSEYSSSDEHPHHNDSDVGETELVKPGKVVLSNKAEEKKLSEAGKIANKVKETASASKEEKGKVDDKVASLDEAYRTSVEVEKSVELKAQCNKVPVVEDVPNMEKANEYGDTNDLCEDSDDDASPTAKHTSPQAPRTRPGAEHSSSKAESCDINTGETTASDPPPDQSKAGGDSGVEVESMLSWNERQGAQLQHKTQCAFNFSNSVMFDLDVD